MTTRNSKTKQAQYLIKHLNEMKTFPAVATRLVSMIEDDRSSLKEFEDVIKIDPVLVVRLLNLVNSSYFSLRTRIKSISEAVAYIGMGNLRNLIVVDALKKLFSKTSGVKKFSRGQMWLHCAATSICCQMISERIFGKKGEDPFLCGILHDVGIIVEDQVIPDQFDDFCKTFDPNVNALVDYEILKMETCHPVIGSLLTKEWGVNRDISTAIEHHHKSSAHTEPESLTGILQISEYLVSRLKFNAFPDTNYGLESPKLLGHMRDAITEYRALIDDLPDEINKAKEIYALEET